jgi:hypothetical protein
MKYVYAISGTQRLNAAQAVAVLPPHFSFREENGQLLLVADKPDHLTDEQVFYQVQRECDRLYFLTGQQLDPKIFRIERPNGLSTGFLSVTASASIYKPIAPEVDRQNWQGKPLAVQLRLWQLAHLTNTPIAAKINLLFQIIEMTYRKANDYPKYKDPNKCPHPRTEAKLLRHLASHGYTVTMRSELKRYCQHLGISEKFHDPTDADFLGILHQRLSVVEDEAKRIIDDSITRKP